MATLDDSPHISEEKDSFDPQNIIVENLASAVANVGLQDTTPPALPLDKTHDDPQRPMIVYTRAQLLYLHNSPLVKPPEGMPAFKDWFGYDANSHHTAYHQSFFSQRLE